MQAKQPMTKETKKRRQNTLSSSSCSDIVENDPSCSENDGDEESEDENYDQDEVSLPRSLYFFVLESMKSCDWKNNVDKLFKAIDFSKSLILEGSEVLKKILQKSKKRDYNDQKVPPGSSQVQRDINDDRFLLCLLCIQKYKIFDLLNRYKECKEELLEALLWFPRSIEANYFLGLSLKSVADSIEILQKAESHLKKAAILSTSLARERSNAIMSVIQSDSLLTDSNASSLSNPQTNDSKTIKVDDFNKKIIDDEIAAGNSAEEALALLLLQNGRISEAQKHLESQGFSWRLSKDILNYSTKVSGSPDDESKSYVRVLDQALPATALQRLKQVFRPESPFWSEHDYDINANASRKAGYFSYLYPFKTRSSSNCLEQIIDHVLPLAQRYFPQVSECNLAEWWVHSRPHCSGHQLHYDSDETSIENGGKKPRHPLATMVIFLSDKEDSREGQEQEDLCPSAYVGGPTLMTDQVLNGPLAKKGWLAFPKINRICLFDSNYLHGVIPGRGITPHASKRRLTFMIGFWKEICAYERGIDVAGPGQPYPSLENTHYTWPLEMIEKIPEEDWINANDSIVEVTPSRLATVWEPIDSNPLRRVSEPSYHSCFQGF